MHSISDSKYKPLMILVAMVVVSAMTVYAPKVAFIVGVLAFVYGLWQILITRNRYGQAHLYAGFIVGAEVYFRMSFAGLPWEFAKLAVFVMLLLALIVEKKSSKIPILFILYAVLLVPAIFVPDWESIEAFKKEFMFTLFGELIIPVSMFYFNQRRFTMHDIIRFARWVIYGVLLMSVSVYLKTPDFSTIHYGGGSNFDTSGGFGPNQVAVILGLGTIVMGYFLLIRQRLFVWVWLDVLMFFVFTFQGMITFSRGGFFSAVLSLGVAVLLLYAASFKKARELLHMDVGKMIILVLVIVVSYIQINNITSGALGKRYTNIDQYGNQVKEDYSTKRLDIIKEDIVTFQDNMFIGAGIGGGRVLREELTGISAAHVEYSRILAEHGILGVLALFILIIYPFYYFWNIEDTVTRFTFVVFVGYALLTMSHNALRLALPSFFYGFGFVMLSWNLRGQNR